MLPDIPFAVARAAVIKVCRSSPFFSSVAEVVEAARELDPCQEHLPTAAEAWEEVSRLIQDVGPYRAPQYSCDTVKRAARSIGWRINLKTQNSLERIFHYQDRAVRTLMMGGEPWFVAKDVCAALGIVNSRAALDGLEEDEIASVGITDTSSSSRRTITVQIVSEPGLYSLVLKSRRPEAREFRRWITHEVIPVLRRTGGYQLGDDISTTGKLLPFSLRDLLQLAAGVESECEALRQENAALRPKAEFYERVADTSACFSLGETAKMLEVPGSRWRSWSCAGIASASPGTVRSMTLRLTGGRNSPTSGGRICSSAFTATAPYESTPKAAKPTTSPTASRDGS